MFRKCPKTQSATIILRGGAEEFIQEAKRSLNDSIMVVRRAMKASNVLGGAGSIEMELSKIMREHSNTIKGS